MPYIGKDVENTFLVSANDLTVTGNITVSGTVDGRDVAADGTKLNTIETNATADQTAAEIRALVESATDSNVFTDADHTKLNGIEASATADQTAAEIRALVESATDSNVFTDADHTKLNGIETAADVTDTANVVSALTAGTGITIAGNGTIASTVSGTTNASDLTSGTLPNARFPATLPAASGVNLTALNASNLGSGTVPDARFPATLPAISGANLTNLPAAGIANVVDDTSPQLGGDLDVNSNDILMGTESLKFGTSKWEIVIDNSTNTLDFKYNGTVVFSIASNGAVISANNITAYGTP